MKQCFILLVFSLFFFVLGSSQMYYKAKPCEYIIQDGVYGGEIATGRCLK